MQNNYINLLLLFCEIRTNYKLKINLKVFYGDARIDVCFHI